MLVKLIRRGGWGVIMRIWVLNAECQVHMILRPLVLLLLFGILFYYLWLGCFFYHWRSRFRFEITQVLRIGISAHRFAFGLLKRLWTAFLLLVLLALRLIFFMIISFSFGIKLRYFLGQDSSISISQNVINWSKIHWVNERRILLI